MIFGMTIAQFTALHVVISIIGIGSGLVAVQALGDGRWLARWQAVFLATTVLTSVTGFLFPITAFTPALGTGILSMIVLIVALVAAYGFGLRGRARTVYAVAAAAALWLNLFVLVVQSFLKVPGLNGLAPTGTEPPFLIAQALVLIGAIALGWRAVRGGGSVRPA